MRRSFWYGPGALFLLLAPESRGAALLNRAADYPVKKDWKEPAPALKPLESFRTEMLMDFESFDSAEMGAAPMISTRSEQVILVRKLPDEPKDSPAAKAGLAEKMELSFERLESSSRVRVPGLPRPFETKSDLSSFLSSRPLLLRGAAGRKTKIENIEKIRAEALATFHDPVSRTSILALLNEENLLRTGNASSGDSSCLSRLPGKKPGGRWKFSREEQGMKLDYDCEFESWSEAEGKRVAVLKLTANKQRAVRAQPNGVNGMTESSGSGRIYLLPDSAESVLRMETTILAEPMPEEQERLKKRGESVPRNRSFLKHSSHLLPL